MGELGLLQVRLVPKSRLPVTAGSLSSYSHELKVRQIREGREL